MGLQLAGASVSEIGRQFISHYGNLASFIALPTAATWGAATALASIVTWEHLEYVLWWYSFLTIGVTYVLTRLTEGRESKGLARIYGTASGSKRKQHSSR